MAECLIERKGGSVDVDGLTATTNDVAEGETFYGQGSDDAQTGTLKKYENEKKCLEVNGVYTIPPGIYIGNENYIDQDIPVKDGFTINPIAEGSAAGIYGHYINDDIIINGIPNFFPENLRNGAMVGNLIGTWQGYVNNDVLTPYWYGVFAPGQYGNLIANRFIEGVSQPDFAYWNNPDKDTGGESIYFGSKAQSAPTYPAIVFDTPIEMQGVKSITVMYKLPAHSANNYTRLVVAEKYHYKISSGNWNIVPELGQHEVFILPPSDGYTQKTFTLNNASKYHYVYIGIGVAPSSGQGRHMVISNVRLNL